MMRPHPLLHYLILCRICVVPGALYFVKVAAVALILGLYPLAQLEEVMQNFVKIFNVGILTSRVLWTLDPYQVPCEDVHTQLIVQGKLTHILVGRKGAPLLCDSLLQDAEVCSIDCHHAVVVHIVGAQPALEDNMHLWGQRRQQQRQGCEDRYEQKKVILRTAFFTYPDVCQHRHCKVNHKTSSSKTPQFTPSSHRDFSPPHWPGWQRQ